MTDRPPGVEPSGRIPHPVADQGPVSGQVPALLPVLSRGKHRRATEGGCFMEFASYLAGEPWSDHPDCTHPLLASLARLVNDSVSDRGRSRLAPLIPTVIGLQSDELEMHAVIARRCAIVALPMVRPDEQRALAVGLLTAERLLARLAGRPDDHLDDEAAAALDSVPQVRDWARSFAAGQVPRARAYRRHAAPTAVRCAVQGILATGGIDADRALHDLLAGVIDDCRARTSGPVPPVDRARWWDACALSTTESVAG